MLCRFLSITDKFGHFRGLGQKGKFLILNDKINFQVGNKLALSFGMDAKRGIKKMRKTLKYNLCLQDNTTKEWIIMEEGKVTTGNWYEAIAEIDSLRGWDLYGPLDEEPIKCTHYGQLRIHPKGNKRGSNAFFDAIKKTR
jgi:hypothetical protein